MGGLAAAVRRESVYHVPVVRGHALCESIAQSSRQCSSRVCPDRHAFRQLHHLLQTGRAPGSGAVKSVLRLQLYEVNARVAADQRAGYSFVILTSLRHGCGGVRWGNEDVRSIPVGSGEHVAGERLAG